MTSETSGVGGVGGTSASKLNLHGNFQNKYCGVTHSDRVMVRIPVHPTKEHLVTFPAPQKAAGA